jgi:N-acyl-D-aspartate/D-glutamate deacylase
VSDSARKVKDASDLVVSPRFINPPTHYDAQICCDPWIGCSSCHGETSVVMGNCGVGIAPCRLKLAKSRPGTWSMSRRSHSMRSPRALPDVTRSYAPALVQFSAVALIGALVTIACRSSRLNVCARLYWLDRLSPECFPYRKRIFLLRVYVNDT